MEYENGKMGCTGFLHVVKKGDTLYRISRLYGVCLDAIMRANPYINIYNLQEGDEICIPGCRREQFDMPE